VSLLFFFSNRRNRRAGVAMFAERMALGRVCLRQDGTKETTKPHAYTHTHKYEIQAEEWEEGLPSTAE